MAAQRLDQFCPSLATLLSHPGEDYLRELDRLIASGVSKGALRVLRSYRDSISNFPVVELQELYTRTFDLNPLCSPALSVHLFGVESFKRSHLMVGLLDMYRIAGFSTEGESADHMSTVIKFLPYAAADDRSEIVHYILLPGLSKIESFLASKSNPFSSLIRAAIMVVAAETGMEAAYA